MAPAITIAILGAIESLLSATVADGVIGDHHDSNQELVGQGIANILSPIFGGIPATGAIARTMTNINNGDAPPWPASCMPSCCCSFPAAHATGAIHSYGLSGGRIGHREL